MPQAIADMLIGSAFIGLMFAVATLLAHWYRERWHGLGQRYGRGRMSCIAIEIGSFAIFLSGEIVGLGVVALATAYLFESMTK